MSFLDFDIDVYQDYLEGLSVRNKLVAHTKVTANCPSGQRTFARFESEEHISQIKNNGGEKIVVVADYYGQRIGDPDDKRLQLNSVLRFAVKKQSGTGDETDAINEAVRIAEKIMFQFLNMMEVDLAAGCNALEGLQPEKITWNRIEEQPWLDDYYGWDLTVPFLSYMPAHDDEDWEAP